MTTGNLSIVDNDTVDQYTSVGEAVFGFNFPILAASELKVSVNQVELVYGADYTVDGIGDDGGGSVDLTLYGGTDPGDVVTLWQDMPIERGSGFSTGAAVLLPEALNSEFAARVRVEQQLRREIRNALRLPPDDPVGSQDMVLPANALRAGKFLAFDADGVPYPADGTGADGSLRADLASTVDGADGAGLVGYRRSTSMAARSVRDVLRRTIALDDWGTHGDDDHTAAAYAAEAELVAMGGGTLKIFTPGEWRMNFVLTGRNICIEGFGGQSEFDEYCIRPYDINAGPAIQIGDGVATLRYPKLKNLSISGTEGNGIDASLAANNAAYGLRVLGAIRGSFEDVHVYGGLKTWSIEPSLTIPATALGFDRCHGRNDILDSVASRLMYFRRYSDPGYLTGVNFHQFKGNKPGVGYSIEIHGAGCTPHFSGGSYIDCEPNWGVYWNGGQVRPMGLDVDPGATGVVCFTTTDVVTTDTTRLIFGYLTQGGQRIAFEGTVTDTGTLQSATNTTARLRAALALSDDALNGYLLVITGGTGVGQRRLITDYVGATDTATVDAWDVNPDATSTYNVHPTKLLLAEADWHLYRPRIYRAFMGPTTYFSTIADPYSTDVSVDIPAAGRLQVVGADWELGTAGKGLKVKAGSNARIGQDTLVAGSVVVSNTSVTAATRVVYSRRTLGGTAGHLSCAVTAGVGFTITSSSGTDTSVIDWHLVESI